jgi:hypothetical protein
MVFSHVLSTATTFITPLFLPFFLLLFCFCLNIASSLSSLRSSLGRLINFLCPSFTLFCHPSPSLYLLLSRRSSPPFSSSISFLLFPSSFSSPHSSPHFNPLSSSYSSHHLFLLITSLVSLLSSHLIPAGVLTLAFIELIVSVKVGGMPFELGKVNFGGGEQTFIVPKAPPVPTYDTTPFDSTLTGPRSL